MKQTLFMIAVTLAGVLGAFAIEPFVGVAVYYLFAVLRPQYLWEWALPAGIGWSSYVAYATLVAAGWYVVNGGGSAPAKAAPQVQSPPPGRLLTRGGQQPRALEASRSLHAARAPQLPPPVATSDASAPSPASSRYMLAHKAFFVFGAWICITYLTAQFKDVAWPWFLEYLKVFLMFGVAATVVVRTDQIWWVYRLTVGALIYIAYEINFLYLVNGRLDIYKNGYGGLDNNGAGLMIAMGIPLALYAWEATPKIWRWAFLAGIPLMLHAVLMSYSRGAMLSLIVATPLMWVRSRRRWQFTGAMLLLAMLVPFLAGYEIRQRFFTVQEYDTDESANARFSSWNAAIQIANDYPIFGVGVRNSPMLSFQYGADMEGRVIHSQYLQTLADAGYPGLFLYLVALIGTVLTMRRARKTLKVLTSGDATLARSMLNGVETSLFIFCFGALFLSLEVFELPYIMILLGLQIAVVARASVEKPVEEPARQPIPAIMAVKPAISVLRPRPSLGVR